MAELHVLTCPHIPGLSPSALFGAICAARHKNAPFPSPHIVNTTTTISDSSIPTSDQPSSQDSCKGNKKEEYS
ncbi:putative lipoprotein MG321-like protein [Frankliniella fusca]|uniref:Lipoprotein MG321-like protein n=1 Tax=Frankliniella fusca TaxID=407009 RepID=A0AAE1LI48_9NEOP|nr:putative lipoprotein MG321-like protein [Frankliniella fusca]